VDGSLLLAKTDFPALSMSPQASVIPQILLRIGWWLVVMEVQDVKAIRRGWNL
jgi:hypothetical protein